MLKIKKLYENNMTKWIILMQFYSVERLENYVFKNNISYGSNKQRQRQ